MTPTILALAYVLSGIFSLSRWSDQSRQMTALITCWMRYFILASTGVASPHFRCSLFFCSSGPPSLSVRGFMCIFSAGVSAEIAGVLWVRNLHRVAKFSQAKNFRVQPITDLCLKLASVEPPNSSVPTERLHSQRCERVMMAQGLKCGTLAANWSSIRTGAPVSPRCKFCPDWIDDFSPGTKLG